MYSENGKPFPVLEILRKPVYCQAPSEVCIWESQELPESETEPLCQGTASPSQHKPATGRVGVQSVGAGARQLLGESRLKLQQYDMEQVPEFLDTAVSSHVQLTY